VNAGSAWASASLGAPTTNQNLLYPAPEGSTGNARRRPCTKSDRIVDSTLLKPSGTRAGRRPEPIQAQSGYQALPGPPSIGSPGVSSWPEKVSIRSLSGAPNSLGAAIRHWALSFVDPPPGSELYVCHGHPGELRFIRLPAGDRHLIRLPRPPALAASEGWERDQRIADPGLGPGPEGPGCMTQEPQSPRGCQGDLVPAESLLSERSRTGPGSKLTCNP
jgi:hypothetical protein